MWFDHGAHATLTLMLATLPMLACSGRSHASPDPRAPTRAFEAAVITAVEIRAMRQPATTAYDVVQALRPDLLARGRPGVRLRPPRPPNDQSGLLVRVDDGRVGDIDLLREIPAHAVTSIRRLSPVEARARYGESHDMGTLVVTTRGRKP